ncbi:hypothetical protein EJD97_002398 [Solanum chilense]|uniref:Gag-pol polyprotein n=1 Tax=Solanum chilense TaxID=4083 RepID=A0A6N2BY31_SOLCI|nr:hypothetical protein EJD97_002398 [Solanum chilense]
MNTRRNAERRFEEEITNAEAPPRDDQVPSLEEDANVDQAQVNPPPLMDSNIRSALIHLAQAATAQAQNMKALSNQEIIPRPHQQVTTITSHLRDFTRMNHPTFYGSKVEEEPQEFIDEVYKILFFYRVIH